MGAIFITSVSRRLAESSPLCVLAVRRHAWGPLVAYLPLMSSIFFTEMFIRCAHHQTIQNSGSPSESRSGFARSLFRLDGLPRLRDQSPHSPAALILKSFYPPLGDACF